MTVVVRYFIGESDRCTVDVRVTETERLQELQHAHQIIKNALAVMDPRQKSEWAALNHRAGSIGDGDTRFHARQLLIDRALRISTTTLARTCSAT